MSFVKDIGSRLTEKRMGSVGMKQSAHSPTEGHKNHIAASTHQNQGNSDMGHDSTIKDPCEIDEFNFFLGLHAADTSKAVECEEDKIQHASNDDEHLVRDASEQDESMGLGHCVLEASLPPSIMSLLTKISREHDDVLMSTPDLPEDVRTSGLLQVDCLQSAMTQLADNRGESMGAMLHVFRACSLLAVLKQAADLILKFGPRVAFLYLKHVR